LHVNFKNKEENNYLIYRISIIFLFLLCNIIFAQSNLASSVKETKYKIDSIKIIGNDITEEDIILRELNFSIGDTISKSQIEFNKERIFSLGIFNKIELIVIKKSNFNILEIKVYESWYFYPLPYLILRDERISHASYGVLLLYKNFRGRNETITGLASFGYNPTYTLSYYNPVLISGEDLTFGFSFGYVDTQNRNIISYQMNGQNFNYDYYFTMVTLGYRLNLYNTISISPSFEYYSIPEKISSLSASNENIDRTLSINLRYEFDNRNLKQFSDNGLFTVLSLAKRGLGINNINYSIMTVDFREYRKVIGDLSAKWRGFYRHTFGEKVPFYELSLLGDIEFVRGHKFDKREGNNHILTSLEFNYPIIKTWDLSLDLPLLPKRLTSARIGIYTNLFIDTGTTYYNGTPLTLKSFDSGYGFGFTILILPYNAFRLEYGFNEIGKGQFLLESGFSF